MPDGAAPLLTGTYPASVRRFSTLQSRHVPSDTHAGALGVFVAALAFVDRAESVRDVAAAGGGAAAAESARGDS
jgi:hypothetical protein